jgi:CheY-like chemotaxis protein
MTPDLPLQILLSCQTEPRRTKVGAALQFLGPADIRLVADRDTAAAWLDRITFDLVVMDFHAPGLDPLAVLRHMRHHTISRHTPALLCMNAATAMDHELARNAGVTDLVIEPFVSETLLRAIWQIPALSRRLAGKAPSRGTDGGNDPGERSDSLAGSAPSMAPDHSPQAASEAAPVGVAVACTGPQPTGEPFLRVGESRPLSAAHAVYPSAHATYDRTPSIMMQRRGTTRNTATTVCRGQVPTGRGLRTPADADRQDGIDWLAHPGVTAAPVPDLERKIARLETKLALLCRDLWESHRRDAGLVAVQGRLLREIRSLDPASEILTSETVDAVRAAAIAEFEEFVGAPDGYIDLLIRTMAEE